MSAGLVTPLPPALRAWGEALAWVDPALQPGLGELAAGLSLLLRPLRRPLRLGLEEPNGYDGLARKGKPQHLLLSEWALAQELPDEFMRRAAMHELLYLQPERVQEQPTQVCTALLDAGPLQHGAPRLAHLAALIVLARRATAAQADFRWGVLQSPQADWDAPLSRANARRWCEGRLATPVTQAQWQAWEERFAREELAPGEMRETWVIGSARACAQARERMPRWRTIAVSEPLPPEEGLHLRVAQEGAVREELLPLPPAQTQVRLLRQPWRPDPPALKPAYAKDTPAEEAQLEHLDIHFSPDGRYLAVRQPLGRAMFYTLPDKLNERPLRTPRRFEKGFHPVVALNSWGAKKFLIATAGDDDRLYVNRPGLWLRAVPPVRWVEAGAGPPEGLLEGPLLERGRLHTCLLAAQYGKDRFFLLDAAQSLWCYNFAEAEQAPGQVCSGVRIMAADSGEIIFLARDVHPDPDHRWLLFSLSLTDLHAKRTVRAALPRDISIEARAEWLGQINGAYAWVLRDGERWVIGRHLDSMGSPPPQVIPVLEGVCVLGLLHDGEGLRLLATKGEGLCLLMPDAGGGQAALQMLHLFDAPLACAAYRPQGERVAAVDARGVLHLYDLRARRLMLSQALHGYGEAHRFMSGQAPNEHGGAHG